MRYSEHAAPADLARDLECIWMLSRSEAPAVPDVPRRVLPDGCVEIIVHLGAPFASRASTESFEAQPDACIGGPSAQPLWLEAPPIFRTVGMRFRPGAARAFVGVPIAELSDANVPLDALWGKAAHELCERLHASPSTEQLLRAAATALRSHAAAWAQKHRPSAAQSRTP